jgi:hypothetical protein
VADFTADEISTSIDQFLFKAVQVDILKSGSRDITAARTVVYDLITAALLMKPDSFFYVVWLATNKLKGQVQTQLDAVDLITTEGPNVNRPAKKINSTTELANARAALLEVNSGLNTRTVGIAGSIGPAIDRFRTSVTRFLNTEITKNVVVGGQVEDTADGSRVKIQTAWTAATEQHTAIVGLARNVDGALASLEAVRLPQTAVQDITNKVQTRLEELESALAGTQGVEQSRQAMLDLLTMRTLMTRAASFRAPTLVLAPLTGDSSQLAMVDSGGTEAQIFGTISGPFNYDPGTTLSVSINSGASTPVFTLPRHSKAELRSKVFSVWADPPGTSIIEITLDITGSAGPYTTTGPYGSGPAAAAAFDAALVGVSVTWDAGTSQLVFRSDNNTDISRLRFRTTTSNHAAFVAWAFNGGLLEARSVPPTPTEIVQSVMTGTPLLSAEVDQVFYNTFTGYRTSVGGEEAILWNLLDSGVDLVANGSNVVTSPSKNLARLGIKVGMAVDITAPGPSVGQYVIQAVAGNQLTLDAVVAATPAATYRIGPDYRGVPAGARVQMTSLAISDNSAFYRVASGLVGRLVLDRNIPQADAALVVVVSRQTMRLRALGTATSSGVGILVPSAGATALGLAVTAGEAAAGLTTFQLVGNGDFLARGVRPGDRLLLTSPTPLSYTRSVSAVTTTQLTVTDPVPREAGNWAYQVQSERVHQYETLLSGPTSPYLDQFLSSPYVVDFNALDLLVGRLIRGAKYTGQIATALAQYRSDLANLLTALTQYAVPSETTIDNVIRTMREQGFDRATDLFLSLAIQTFFSMDPDGVSYSTWLVRNAATAARQVAPVSKLSSKLTTAYQEWRPISFQRNPLTIRDESNRT